MSSSEELSWLAEPPIGGFQQRAAVTAPVYQGSSPFQRIEVFDTVPFGRTLVLEGAVQTTLGDEFIYHEMLVHPAMLGHFAPRRVLIIGGGDGGTLRRVLEHQVEQATMVELDRIVVDVCERHMPAISGGAFLDPRGKLVIGDGIRFAGETQERFDVAIVDSTDPVGPAKGLFDIGFYRSIHRLLNDDGLVVTQSGSPILMRDELREAVQHLRAVFPFVLCYLVNVPSYPGSLWSFLLAGKRPAEAAYFAPDAEISVRSTIAERYARAALQTRYYTPDLHFASFALPTFIANIVGGGAEA